MPDPEKKFTSADVVQLLKARFHDRREYAVYEQVANGTGYVRNKSWIDVMVIALWPSSGLTRSAFEIKVDRADFLKEMRMASKNDWARECCHEFWYAAPAGVINHADEVPPGCGWMEVQKNRLVTRKNAPRNPNPANDDLLVASIARSAQNHIEEQARDLRETILSSDPEVMVNRVTVKALEDWLKARRKYLPDANLEQQAQSIARVLDEATADKAVQELAANAIDQLFRFRNSLLDLWKEFTVIAHVALMETDTAGNAILQQHGVHEKAFGIALLRAQAALTGKGHDYESQNAKADLETIQQITNLDLLLPKP